MVGIGICGIGFMGMIHYLAARKVPGARVTAISTRDPKKLAGDWSSIRGNFGPRGGQMDLSGVNRHAEYDDLLADPSVQLVDLCVPNDRHAEMAIQALRAGKHVLVEKPIALTVEEADAMLAAARENHRLLMVAHVLPFFPEFAYALQAARSGRYGAIRAAHLMRVISRPDWSSGIAEVQRSGGPAIDLHIHDTHFIGLLCGVPTAVHARGVVEDGAVVHLTTQYLYDGGDGAGPAVSALSGALSMKGREFAHGFDLYFERATLSFEFASLGGQGHLAIPLSVILPDGSVQHPEVGGGDPVDAFTAELRLAVEGATTGREPPELAGDLARQALAICQAEVESVKSRKLAKIT